MHMHMLSHLLALALAVAAKCTAPVDCAPAPLLDLQAGETPLYEVCRQGRTAVAQLLLDRGANVDAANKARRQGCVPVHRLHPNSALHATRRCSPSAFSAALARCCLPCAALQQLH
jgi:hypothetical protein